MARGQRKTIEEKIIAKQELIDALMTRIESEKRELEEQYAEKCRREISSVGDLIAEPGLQTDEVAALLQQSIDERAK